MTDELPQEGTFRRWAYDRSTAAWRSKYGRRSLGALTLLWDTLTQATLDAWRAPMLELEFGPAYDALRPIGQEQSMPQYPAEDWIAYRNRLRDPWLTWEFAGTEQTLIDQLAAAGVPNARIIIWGEGEFIVFYGEGDHAVTGYRTYGDGASYGDPGLVYGPTGIPGDTLRALKGLINHWKPAEWVCPFVLFEISGHTYGTGHTYGEPGLVYGGGTQARLDIGR